MAKKDKKNIKYKKLTVEIPMTTFERMKSYCMRDYSQTKSFFYCDFINLAILEYINNHFKSSPEKIRENTPVNLFRK